MFFADIPRADRIAGSRIHLRNSRHGADRQLGERISRSPGFAPQCFCQRVLGIHRRNQNINKYKYIE